MRHHRPLRLAVALALCAAAPLGVHGEGWSSTLGGPGSEIGFHVHSAPGDGCVVTGSSESFGGAWVLRLDAEGRIAGQRVIEPATPWLPVVGAATPDGGSLVAGAGDMEGRQTPWLAKLDPSGAIQWQRAWRFGDSGVARDVARRTNGGIAVAVAFDHHGALLWLDSSGGLVFCDELSIDISSLAPTADGGLVVSGDVGDDGVIYRYDASGVVVARQVLSSPCGLFRMVCDAVPDGSVIVAGSTGSCGAAFAAHLDSTLQPLVAAEFQAPRETATFYSVAAVAGGFVAFGEARFGGRPVAVRLDAALNIEWQSALGAEPATFLDGAATENGGVLATGWWHWWPSELLVVRMDASGGSTTDCGHVSDAGLVSTRLLMTTGTFIDPRRWGAMEITATLVSRPTTAVSVALGDDQEPDDCAAAPPLLAGPAVSRNFCNDAEDWYEIHACAGGRYSILTSALGRLTDTVVDLLDADCTTLLASDDDGGGGAASRLEWTCPRDGAFRVRVRQRDGSAGDDRGYDVQLLQSGGCDDWIRSFTLDLGCALVAAAEVSDGGVVVGGVSADASRPTGDDVVLLRVRPTGEVRSFEHVVAPETQDVTAIVPHGGGHVLFGRTSLPTRSIAFARAERADGAPSWQRSYETAGDTSDLLAATALRDGGMVAVGSVGSGAVEQAWVLRLDSDGDVAWSRVIESPALYSAQATSVVEAADGQLTIAGSALSRVGPLRPFVTVLDAAGDVVEHRTYATWQPSGIADVAPTGAVVLAGDRLITMVDADGRPRWSVVHDDWHAPMPTWTRALATSDGGALLAGGCTSDDDDCEGPFLAKLDAAGRCAWTRKLFERGLSGGPGRFVALDARADGGFVALTEMGTLLRLDVEGRAGDSCPESSIRLTPHFQAATLIVESATTPSLPVTVRGPGFVVDAARATAVEHCFGRSLAPPGEVSPPGAAVPLRVSAGGLVTWSPPEGDRVVSYDVYRGELADLPGSHGLCLASGVTDLRITDPDPPPPSGAWTYLVTGVNAAGEGTMGFDSLGAERTNAAPCP